MTAIVRIAVVLALVTLLPTPALAVGIVFDTPSEGATVTGSVVVAVTVSSASGDRSIKISLDGLPFASESGIDNSLSGDWYPVLSENGPHILSATVTDASGASASATRAVFVNNPIAARLRLVSARDHIEIAASGVYADADRIYVGGTKADLATGRLYVLARDRARDFPVVETLDFPQVIRTVLGDDTYLYVLEFDTVHVYRKTSPLSLVTSFVPPAPHAGGTSGIAIVGDRLYVGIAQARVNADARHIYLAAENTSADVVVEILRDTWAVGRTYATTEARSVGVFDRFTGERLTTIPAPVDTCGQPGSPSNLYVDSGVFIVSWGRCGAGMSLYDPVTLALVDDIASPQQPSRGTNVALRRDHVLLSGDEAGAVRAWDLMVDPATMTDQLLLRVVTGHTGSEDIEIRSIWTDAIDALVFAGSSWGNATSRAPTLPSLFVLEVTDPEPTVTITAATNAIPEGAGPTDAFVISRTGSTATSLTVRYSVGGTALAGTDYPALLGSTTIPVGAASTTISLAPVADGMTEGDETVVVTLTPAAGYYVGSPASAAVIIRDAVRLGASFTTPSESAIVSGTVTVGMAATNPNGGPITFTLTVDGAQIFTVSGMATNASFDWNSAPYPAGSHTLGLIVRDGSGATAMASRNVTVVAAANLRVAITQPAADGATVKDTTWFVLWVDGATTGTKTYTLTSGGKQLATTNDTSSGPISMAWDTRQLNSGSNTVIATVRDSAGNTGNASRAVNVANCVMGAPFTASITSPTEDATVNGTVPVNMAEAGACGTPITFTLTLDGTQVFTTSGTATSASFNWITGAGGLHTLVLMVRDGTGSTASATRHVTVEGPPPPPGPLPIFTSPPEGATVSGVVTVGMSRGDTGTGTINWTLKIDGTTVFTETSAATSRTYSWNTGPYAAGPHTLALTLQDPSSGSSTTATRNVTVAGPLTASITSPAEGATVSGPVTVGMSETNATSGPMTWTLQLDGGSTPIFTTSGTATTASFNWDTSGVAAGAHQLQLTVQDNAGRTASATRNVTVASTGTIRVFITQPGTDGTTVNGTVWFTIWLENAAAGTRNLTLSIDGAAVATTATTSNGPISMPWNSRGASGGTHTATMSVRDSVHKTGSASRTVVIQGPAALTASFTSPAEGATVRGMVTVGMFATGASGTPITFTLSVDGGSPVFTTSGAATTASFGWNSNSVSTGARTLNLMVQDGAGRTANAVLHVTVTDLPPPMVQITTPAEGATVGGTITVAASLTTAGPAPFTWTVKVDNTAQVFTSTGSVTSISFAWNTTTVPDGPRTLNVSVQDSTGATASAVRNITVQQPPPATIKVFITQPGADGATVSGTTWFTIWIENAAAGNRTFTMSVDGTAVGTPTNTTSNGPVSMPWTTNGTPNGSHSVTISVRDSAGGTGQAVRVVNVAN